MKTIYRAQGIKKRWFDFKQTDSKTVPIMMFIDYQYQRYLELCNRCNEEPLSKGKWLLQKVEAKA